MKVSHTDALDYPLRIMYGLVWIKGVILGCAGADTHTEVLKLVWNKRTRRYIFISIYISLALLSLYVEIFLKPFVRMCVYVLLANSDLCLVSWSGLNVDVRSVLCITDIFDGDLLLGDLDFMKWWLCPDLDSINTIKLSLVWNLLPRHFSINCLFNLAKKWSQ